MPEQDTEPRFRGAEPREAAPDPATEDLLHRDIIVVGASAGGVEALQQLVSGLPPELPAAVLVVLHLPPSGRSVLPEILARAGPLAATAAADRQRPERGCVHVAPPDRHLVLAGGEMRLTAGPRENGHRPAIDPLFRSVARGFGPRAIGVVMSGNLDDGAAGARLIKARGGAVLTQDPDDALYPEMPVNVAAVVDVDASLPPRALAAKICEMVEEPIEPRDEADLEDRRQREAEDLAEAELAGNGRDRAFLS